ncbi:MAG: response regulator transcription factor [SAR202 cluster bacterium]|nr:response regulator transcription factor [SAR202 cluster bacterium]
MDKSNARIRPNVLVVEDDQSITRMLRFSLHSVGFGITEVSTGTDALVCMDSEPPAAVVLDLGLSDGNAPLVLNQLRCQPDNAPAWVCISSLDLEDASNEHGPLGDHFFGKPFNPWELVGILKNMMSSSEQPDSLQNRARILGRTTE